jgi:hypothetical protein
VTNVDWQAAPAWAQWWAVDADGIARWHERRPRVDGNAWRSAGRTSPAGIVYLASAATWRWSLTERETEAVG